MLIFRIFAALAAASLLAAQSQPAKTPPTGSIEGQVLYAVTNAPVPDATVSVRVAGKAVEAKTDAQGRYTLNDVPPGPVRITAQDNAPKQFFAPFASRQVVLSPGQDLTSIDFHLEQFAQITGKVVDENREPVPGMLVWLVVREYSHGALRYFFAGGGSATDDQGVYTAVRVEPGRPYLLMAQPLVGKVDAISNSPTDPAMRRRVAAPTFYPGSTSIEAGQMLTLRSGEVREGIDLPVIRGPSLCIEGHVLAGTSPGPLRFDIAPARPTFGQSGTGGVYGRSPWSGNAGPDGAIRACGLTPGSYTLTARREAADAEGYPAFYGTAHVDLSDADLSKIAIAANPRVAVPVEVLLDGPPPAGPAAGGAAAEPLQNKIRLSVQSLTRAPYRAELEGGAVALPGNTVFDGMLADDYVVSVYGIPTGMYLKEMTYNNASIFRGLLSVGSAPVNAALRITIGQDGGFVQVKASDKDGNPTADANVVVFPTSATTEGDVAVTYITGQTDQNGVWKSGALAPGQYHVLAATTVPDRSPESIAKLMAARASADPVEVGPGATVSVPVTERSLE